MPQLRERYGDHISSQEVGFVEPHLLDAVENGRFRSRRAAAAEIGIAPGLVNAYVKRCVRKGWLKGSNAPVRPYSYYLTPQGASERARLSARYLHSSMHLFRKARTDYAAAFSWAEALGWRRVALVGMLDLTEIASLCALESEIEIVAIVAPDTGRTSVVGIPVIASLHALDGDCDGLPLTQIDASRMSRKQYAAHSNAAFKMLMPRFLESSLFEADATMVKEA
jgi:hypothetical protein